MSESNDDIKITIDDIENEDGSNSALTADDNAESSDDPTKQGLPTAITTAEYLELLQKVKEAEELKDRYQRLMAEFDNYKKRHYNDIEQCKQRTKAECFREFLPIGDVIINGIKSARESGAPQTIIQGLELIYKEFLSILESEQIKVLDLVGEQFDPEYAEAVATLHRDDIEPNTIVEELSKGYLYKDQLLRPAMVIVSR